MEEREGEKRGLFVVTWPGLACALSAPPSLFLCASRLPVPPALFCPPHSATTATTRPTQTNTTPGVRGTVTAAGSGAPLAATLYVKSAPGAPAPIPFAAAKRTGFYARPLAPGRYTVVATAPGFAAAEADVVVPEGGAGAVLDFKLQRGRSSAKLLREVGAAA